MRIISIAAALVFVASVAHAQQDLDLDDDNYDLDDLDFDDDYDEDFDQDYEETEDRRMLQDEGDKPVKVRCKDRATGPEHKCWLKSDKYHAQARGVKMETIWNKVEGSRSDEPIEQMWNLHGRFFEQKANGSFCQRSDEIINRRREKATHTQGLVAQVEYVPTDNDLGYSGILGEGSDTVLMRISESANLWDGASGLTPSIALKFLVDGIHSQNVMAMQRFGSSNSWNFFEPSLTNRLPMFDRTTQEGYIMDETLRKKLTEGSQRPFGLGFSHIARHTNAGKTLTRQQTKVPYQIWFSSPQASKFSAEKEIDAAGNQVMWYDQITEKLSEGDVVYDVLAQTEPYFDGESEETHDKKVKIGELRLKTDLIHSKWADEDLYFQHRNIGRDRRFWPREWRRLNEDKFFSKKVPENIFGNEKLDWPRDMEEAQDLYIDQVEKWGCPFEWLMPEGWQEAWDGATV